MVLRPDAPSVPSGHLPRKRGRISVAASLDLYPPPFTGEGDHEVVEGAL
jgi:hypothetical protein